MATGKRYTDATKRFDQTQLHGPTEAIDLVKSLATSKFDETIEMVVQLGVDPRKADQQVRGTVALPAGRATVPRTCWSALRGSTPSWTTISIVSSNFAVARLFTRSIASVGPCSWVWS